MGPLRDAYERLKAMAEAFDCSPEEVCDRLDRMGAQADAVKAMAAIIATRRADTHKES